jgi:hypothetical protein
MSKPLPGIEVAFNVDKQTGMPKTWQSRQQKAN